jgi:hypothetical protein
MGSGAIGARGIIIGRVMLSVDQTVRTGNMQARYRSVAFRLGLKQFGVGKCYKTIPCGR